MKSVRTTMWIVTYKGRYAKDSFGGYYLYPTKKDAREGAANKALQDFYNRHHYSATKVRVALDAV